MKAPQNPVDATDSTATIDFTPQQDAVEIWVYPGISTGGSLRITDAAGNELYQKELSYATPFCWTKTAITAPAGRLDPQRLKMRRCLNWPCGMPPVRWCR